MSAPLTLDKIKALLQHIKVCHDEVFETGNWTFTMPIGQWRRMLKSREYQHGRAIAMRQVWCDQQSPKAWPR